MRTRRGTGRPRADQSPLVGALALGVWRRRDQHDVAREHVAAQAAAAAAAAATARRVRRRRELRLAQRAPHRVPERARR